MLTAALLELENACVEQRPDVVLADAQYWNEQHTDDVTAEHGIPVLIPLGLRQTHRRTTGAGLIRAERRAGEPASVQRLVVKRIEGRVVTVLFPGESEKYPAARRRLPEQEIALRRAMKEVAASRRALPPGGLVPEDYVFQATEVMAPRPI
jgi:hypothetical protein